MYSSELSGLVLTHGERNPETAITQLSELCDQVVVVADTRSVRDVRVPEIRDGCDITVVERPFDTFPGQRNAGLEQTLGTWALVVDSDEELSDRLMEEVAHLDPPKDIDVYMLSRYERIGGRTLRATLDGPHPRLFRSRLRYSPRPVIHEQLEDVEQLKFGALNSPLIHAHQDPMISLIRRYFGHGRDQVTFGGGAEPFSWFRVAINTPNNIIREGFLRDGMPGLYLSAAITAYRLGTKFPRHQAR